MNLVFQFRNSVPNVEANEEQEASGRPIFSSTNGQVPGLLEIDPRNKLLQRAVEFIFLFANPSEDGNLSLSTESSSMFPEKVHVDVIRELEMLRREIFLYLNGSPFDLRDKFAAKFKRIKRTVFNLRKKRESKRCSFFDISSDSETTTQIGDKFEVQSPLAKESVDSKFIDPKLSSLDNLLIEKNLEDSWFKVGKGGKTLFAGAKFSSKFQLLFRGGGTDEKCVSVKTNVLRQQFANDDEFFEHAEDVTIIKAKPDGSCQYHAVIEGLKMSGKKYWDTEPSVQDLRNLVADRLQEHVRKNTPFYCLKTVPEVASESNSSDSNPSPPKIPGLLRLEFSSWVAEKKKNLDSFMMEQYLDHENNFKRFCWGPYIQEGVRKQKWGDLVTLNVLAEIFNAKFKVVQPDSNTLEFTTPVLLEGDPKSRDKTRPESTVFLLLHRNHFDSIFPQESSRLLTVLSREMTEESYAGISAQIPKDGEKSSDDLTQQDSGIGSFSSGSNRFEQDSRVETNVWTDHTEQDSGFGTFPSTNPAEESSRLGTNSRGDRANESLFNRVEVEDLGDDGDDFIPPRNSRTARTEDSLLSQVEVDLGDAARDDTPEPFDIPSPESVIIEEEIFFSDEDSSSMGKSSDKRKFSEDRESKLDTKKIKKESFSPKVTPKPNLNIPQTPISSMNPRDLEPETPPTQFRNSQTESKLRGGPKKYHALKTGFNVKDVKKVSIDKYQVCEREILNFLPHCPRLSKEYKGISFEEFELDISGKDHQKFADSVVSKFNLQEINKGTMMNDIFFVFERILKFVNYRIEIPHSYVKFFIFSFFVHSLICRNDDKRPESQMFLEFKKLFVEDALSTDASFCLEEKLKEVIDLFEKSPNEYFCVVIFCALFKVRFHVFEYFTNEEVPECVECGLNLDLMHRPLFILFVLGDPKYPQFRLCQFRDQPAFKLTGKNVRAHFENSTENRANNEEIHDTPAKKQKRLESDFERSDQENDSFQRSKFEFSSDMFQTHKIWGFDRILKISSIACHLPRCARLKYKSDIDSFPNFPEFFDSSNTDFEKTLKNFCNFNDLVLINSSKPNPFSNVFEMLSAVLDELHCPKFATPDDVRQCVLSQLLQIMRKPSTVSKVDRSISALLKNKYSRCIRTYYNETFNSGTKACKEFFSQKFGQPESSILAIHAFSDIFKARFRITVVRRNASGIPIQNNETTLNDDSEGWPIINCLIVFPSFRSNHKEPLFYLLRNLNDNTKTVKLTEKSSGSGDHVKMDKRGRFVRIQQAKPKPKRKAKILQSNFSDEEWAKLQNGISENFNLIDEDDGPAFDHFDNLPSFQKNIVPSIKEFFQHMSDESLNLDICSTCSVRVPKYLQDEEFVVPFDKFSKILFMVVASGSIINLRVIEKSPSEFKKHLKSFDLDEFGIFFEEKEIGRRGKKTMDVKCNVCFKCRKCFFADKPRLPPASLANGNQLAEIPKVFEDLTLAEECIISPYRTVMRVYKLRDAGGTVAHKALKGNCIAFPQDVEKLQDLIVPLNVNSLSEVLQIIFVGKTASTGDLKNCLKRICKIRKNVVLEAVKEMKKYSSDITISEENLNLLPDSDEGEVPDAVLDCVYQVDEDNVDDEEVGYFKRGPVDANSTNTNIPDDHTELFKFGVVDVNNTTVSPDVSKFHAVNNFLSELHRAQKESEELNEHDDADVNENEDDDVDNENIVEPGVVNVGDKHVLVFPRKGDPISEYKNENLWLFGFPTLFPQGKGAPEQRNQRKVPFSLKDWCSHALCIRDSRFRKHPTFLFYIANMLRRRDVAMYSRLKLKSKISDEDVAGLEALKNMSSAEFEAAAKAFQTSGKIDNPNLKRIVELLTVSGSNISSHVLSKSKMRQEIQSMFLYHGLPRLFITVNPNDFSSTIVCHYAGKCAKIECSPEELPDYWSQRKAAADDPVASALFFNIMVEAIITHLLGFRKDNASKIGILGKVKNYYGTVESQGRGTLHLHMLVWLDGFPSPSELLSKFESEEFRERFKTYLDTIISASIGECDPKILEEVQNRPSIPLPENFHEIFKNSLVKFANRFQRHKCTHTCHKYQSGSQKCRFGFSGEGKPIFEETEVREDGSFDIKRNKGDVNQFNPALLYCLQSNMDINFISTAKDSRAISFYVCFYITKNSLMSQNIVSLLGAVMEKIKRFPINSKSDENKKEKCRRELERCFNQLNALGQVCGPEAAAYVLGDRPFRSGKFGEGVKHYWDHYTGCQFDSLFLGEFLRQMIIPEDNVQPRDEFIDDAFDINDLVDESDEIEFGEGRGNINVINRGRNVTFSFLIEDYLHRNDSLQEICLYEFVSQFSKNKAPLKTKTDENGKKFKVLHFPKESIRFEPTHPLFNSHYMSKRLKPVCPRISKLPPNREVQPETYAKVVLLMFVPFKNKNQIKNNEKIQELDWVSYLLRGSTDWSTALDTHTNMGSFKKTVSKYLKNLEEIQGSMEQRLIDAQKKKDRDTSQNSEESNDKGTTPLSDADIFMDLGEDPDEPFDEFVVQNPKDPSPSEDVIDRAINDIFGADDNSKTNQNFDNPFESGPINSNFQNKFRSWKSELRKQEQIELSKIMDDTDGDIDDNVAFNPINDPSNNQQNSQSDDVQPFILDLTKTELLQIKRIIISNDKLNEEQARAFSVVANHVIDNILSEDESEDKQPKPLFLQVLGEGGTGKSRIINSIKNFFVGVHRKKWLKLCAPTGKAASLINGTTIHSLFHLPIHSNEKKLDKVASENLSKKWQNAKYCIVDEVSMVSCGMLQRMNNSVVTAKGEAGTGIFFAGISLILFGDFFQFNPIAGHALYFKTATVLDKCTPKIKTPVLNNNQMLPYYGSCNFWSNFTKVVILKKQVRAANDPEYLKFLNRNRFGNCTSEDIEFLRKKVGLRLNPNDFSTRFIVSLNATRMFINEKMVQRFAKHHNKPIFWKDNVGQFVTREDHVPVPVGEEVLNKSETETKGVEGKVRYVIGAPVLVTRNLQKSLGITNGATGTLHSIIFHSSDEKVLSEGIDLQDNLMFKLKQMPLCLVVKFDNPIKFHHEDFEPNCAPIFPVSATFGHSFTTNKTINTFPFKEPVKRVLNIKRVGFPLTLNFATTAHKCQGETLNSAVVDLNFNQNQRSSFASYVPLSRLKTSKSLSILREFDGTVLQLPVEPELLSFMEQADIYDKKTKEEFLKNNK